MKKNEQKDMLMNLFWDMDIQFTPREIYSFLTGEKKIDGLNRNRLLARMLSTLRWYDIIDIFGLEKTITFLQPEVIHYIWPSSQKKRFENVSKLLCGRL